MIIVDSFLRPKLCNRMSNAILRHRGKIGHNTWWSLSDFWNFSVFLKVRFFGMNCDVKRNTLDITLSHQYPFLYNMWGRHIVIIFHTSLSSKSINQANARDDIIRGRRAEPISLFVLFKQWQSERWRPAVLKKSCKRLAIPQTIGNSSGVFIFLETSNHHHQYFWCYRSLGMYYFRVKACIIFISLP